MRPPDAGPGTLDRAAIGPLTGGLLLVAFSGSAALGLAGRRRLGRRDRRTRPHRRGPAPLAGPAHLGPPDARHAVPAGDRRNLLDDRRPGCRRQQPARRRHDGSRRLAPLRQTVAFVAGALAAFSGVYYAMLIYAPRQVAEPEGGPVTWLVRYGIFLASVIVGVAWLRPFGI